MAAPEQVRRSRKVPPAGASAPDPLRRLGRAVRTACPAAELQDRTRTRRPTAGQSRFPGQASPPFRLSNFQENPHYARPIGPWFSSSFTQSPHTSPFSQPKAPNPLNPKFCPRTSLSSAGSICLPHSVAAGHSLSVPAFSSLLTSKFLVRHKESGLYNPPCRTALHQNSPSTLHPQISPSQRSRLPPAPASASPTPSNGGKFQVHGISPVEVAVSHELTGVSHGILACCVFDFCHFGLNPSVSF